MIRLDLAEAKFPLPPGLVRELQDSINLMNSYPSGGYVELKEAYSRYSGISPNGITAWNGLDEAIDSVTRVFGKSVCLYTPTFSQFELAAKRRRSKTMKTDSLLFGEYGINPSLASRCSLTWICNPNNPTGTLVPRNAIEEALSESPGVVAVDEAYFEYSGVTAAELLEEYDNLLILRGLSKGFGLSGLRVGFVLSSEKNARKLESVRQVFNVNLLAEIAGSLVFKYLDYYCEMRGETKTIRDEFAAKLRQLGIFVFPSATNFVLAGFSSDAERDSVVGELARSGISVFSAGSEEFSGLSGPFIRFTIGSKEEMETTFETVKNAAAKSRVRISQAEVFE